MSAKWQTIETAPSEDLVEVLLTDGCDIYVGHMWRGDWSVDGGLSHDEDSSMFTHWMPLPGLPECAAPGSMHSPTCGNRVAPGLNVCRHHAPDRPVAGTVEGET